MPKKKLSRHKETEKRAHMAKKSLGQHFLMHAAIARRIALCAPAEPKMPVLEIGPGTGILTEALLERFATVLAVEADGSLIEGLRTRFAPEIKSGRLILVHDDIRRYLADRTHLTFPYQVVANIPYYLTGEIMRMLLTREHQPASLTLLVQKEIAERIAREKKGSLLALSVRVYGTPKYAFTVPKGAFVPEPKVNSAVLSVRNISRERFVSRRHEEHFFELLRAGFAHKRKYVRSNLRTCGVDTASIPSTARAEDLSLAEWLALAQTA